jgi:hypothetical protein
MHFGTFFLFFFFFVFRVVLEAEFMYLFSGILSVNLMSMMMNTVVLHVKGSAIVPFVVVNGVKHMLESRPAINILHHHVLPGVLVSSLAPKRTYPR